MHPPNGLTDHPAFELLEEVPDLGLGPARQLPDQLGGIWLRLTPPSLQ
jgi:hypothetical protein